MRLCGISSRFRLLSPGTGQVPHALLTRPPLSRSSLLRKFGKSASFDLHVLGTPPAFILSQDQTLMLKSDPSSGRFPRLQNLLAPGSPRAFILSPVFTVFKVLRSPARVDLSSPSAQKQSVRCILSDASEISLIKESFKVYPLFSYQGSFRCRLCISRRQLVYYITFGNVCQQLFLFFCDCFLHGSDTLSVLPALRNQLDYIITYIFECQLFF